jgi:signal transduction histidine kinase
MSRKRAPEGEATLRLDHTMAAAVGASRVFVLLQSVGISWTLRRRVPRPHVLAAGVAALAGHTAWAAQRSWRRGSIRDRTVALSDGVAQCFALAIEAGSWGTRTLPDDPRWSETFGAVVTSWLAFEEPSLFVNAGSLLAWIATYVATSSSRSATGTLVARGKRINEVTGHVAFSGVGRLLGRQLLGQATELDTARAAAIVEAERLATEVERHRQHRMIHDSALQILEAVAGGWDLDEQLLRRRIDYETERIRRVVNAAGEMARPLAEQLDALVETFALLGLEVQLETSAARAPISQRGADALGDATHEALMNVHKHAAVQTVTVRAATEEAGTEVRVTDRGRGFDPTRPRLGFGLTESIEGRMRDAGGGATVWSAPGAGTDVRLWVPA